MSPQQAARPRRWATEDQVLLEMERLADESMQRAADYTHQAVQAAQAEATHKALRARRQLLARANGTKSMAEAEVTAEADETVALAYLERLTTAATAEACREALRSIRTNIDAMRTAVASQRVAGQGL